MKITVQILLLVTSWNAEVVIGSSVVAISPIVREVEAKKSLYYFKKGSTAGPKSSGAQTPAEDRIFFPPYKFPFWGLPYGVHSNGGFFNPGLFPFVPGGPGFPPFDGVFGGPKGPGSFGAGPNPFGPAPPPGGDPSPPPAPAPAPPKKKPKPKPKKPKYVPKDDCDCAGDDYDDDDDYDCSCSKPVKEKYSPPKPPRYSKKPPSPPAAADCSAPGSKGPKCKDPKPKYPRKESPKRSCKYGYNSGSRGGCKPPPTPPEDPEEDEEEYTPRCRNYGSKRCRGYKYEPTTPSYDDEDEYETNTPAPQQQYLPVVFAYQPSPNQAPSPQPQNPVQYSNNAPVKYDPNAPMILQYTQQSAEQASQSPVMMYYSAQPVDPSSQPAPPAPAPQQAVLMQYASQPPPSQSAQPQPQILQYTLQAQPAPQSQPVQPPQIQPQQPPILQYTIQAQPAPQPQTMQMGAPSAAPQVTQYIMQSPPQPPPAPPAPISPPQAMQYAVTPMGNYNMPPPPAAPSPAPPSPPSPPSQPQTAIQYPVQPYEMPPMVQYGPNAQLENSYNQNAPGSSSSPVTTEMQASQSINNMHSPMLPYEIIYEPPGPSQYVYTPKMRYRYPGFQSHTPSSVPIHYDILQGDIMRPNPIFDSPPVVTSSKTPPSSKNQSSKKRPTSIADKLTEESKITPQKSVKKLGIFDHYIAAGSSNSESVDVGPEPRSSSFEPTSSGKSKVSKDKNNKENLMKNHRSSDDHDEDDDDVEEDDEDSKITQVISVTKSVRET